nr:hypothetical protein [Prolixibacter sp. SD074]
MRKWWKQPLKKVSTKLRENQSNIRFDYVIGSVHFPDNWNHDSDRSRYIEFSNDYLYQWYFAEAQTMLKQLGTEIQSATRNMKKLGSHYKSQKSPGKNRDFFNLFC